MTSQGSAFCPDCGVDPGRWHEEGCDVARCMQYGSQQIRCEPDHDCGSDRWTGEWPGEAECREFGWWVQDRCAEGLGFAPCSPDAPGAMADLNRLMYDAQWSPELPRWVKRSDLTHQRKEA